MLAAGAEGDSLAQLSSCLSWDLISKDEQEVFRSYNEISQQLNSMKGVEVISANSIWSATEFLPGYTQTLQKDFHAEAHKLKSAQEINDWVADKTRNMIPRIIDSLPSQTMGTLVNAIYFKGDWEASFTKERTQPMKFNGVSSQQEVPMMYLKSRLNCVVNPQYSAVELPYQGDQLSFIGILPTERDISEFVSELSAESLRQIVSSLSSEDNVIVNMPKFTLEYGAVDLANTLRSLGVTNVFDPAKAQLTRMTNAQPANVSEIYHKAVCIINETGTQAAAVTAIRTRCIQVRGVVINFDKPFVFFIYAREIGRAHV